MFQILAEYQMKDMALLDQNWAADTSLRICIDSLAVLKGTDCMEQLIKTLDAEAKKNMHRFNTYHYALFIFPRRLELRQKFHPRIWFMDGLEISWRHLFQRHDLVLSSTGEILCHALRNAVY